MIAHNSVAKSVREMKEKYPQDYCADPRCLWRVVTNRGPNPCQKHPHLGAGRPVAPLTNFPRPMGVRPLTPAAPVKAVASAQERCSSPKNPDADGYCDFSEGSRGCHYCGESGDEPDGAA